MHLNLLNQIDEKTMKMGCRDEAPTKDVLKNMSFQMKQKSRLHKNETMSLEEMLNNKTNSADEVLQNILLKPKGVMLWSRRSIQIYVQRCVEDIVYLDATGSIIKRKKGSPPYYVYELVVHNPQKMLHPFQLQHMLPVTIL